MTSNEITSLTKRCNSCGLFLSLDSFHNTKDGCRYGKVGSCKSCMKIKNKAKYLRIRGDMLKAKAVQYKENTKLFAARNKKYRENNPEKVRQLNKNWELNNSGRRRALIACRRARKRNATPKWLNKAQKEQIILYYRLAVKLASINNCKYHVDHIIPLQGSGVCGLHVPWNLQVITADENRKKYNRVVHDTPSKP